MSNMGDIAAAIDGLPIRTLVAISLYSVMIAVGILMFASYGVPAAFPKEVLRTRKRAPSVPGELQELWPGRSQSSSAPSAATPSSPSIESGRGNGANPLLAPFPERASVRTGTATAYVAFTEATANTAGGPS